MKPDTILVQATDASRPVFQPGASRRVIRDGADVFVIRDTPVEVPNTRYYQRRIQAGDLVIVRRVVAISPPAASRRDKRE